MKPLPSRLDEIQRWMQSVIMHPGGVAEGVDSPEARAHLEVPLDELERVIRRSAALSAAERLEIYVNAYYERLLECLREEFAATRQATGEELFDALAFGYLQHSPSRSYTLNQLGAGFPRYLGESRLHAHDVPAGAPASWVEFVIDLAAFERLQRDVFDAPGTEGQPCLDAARLAQLNAEQPGTLRLVPAPCLKLAQFGHPVHEYWHAWKSGESPMVPDSRLTRLAIHRRNWTVERREWEGAQYALLESLLEGATLIEAITAAAASLQGGPKPLEQQLGRWFADWAHAGFFLELRVDRQSRSQDRSPPNSE
jgi:hypothetical protein